MKIKLYKSLFISLILCVFLTSCYSYTDINKVIFVTSILVDIDQDKQVVLYLECFLPVREATKEQAKGQRILFKGRGKTVLEIIKDINLSSSYKLNYVQNNVIIFSEKALEYGMDNFIDAFERQQEFLIRPYIAAFKGDVESLIKLQIKEEEYIGFFVNNLLDNQGASSRTVRMHLGEFIKKTNMGSKTNIITTIELSKEQPETKLQVEGGTIIKDYKFAGSLKKQDGEKYNFLMDKVDEGTLETENPDHQDKLITLDIASSKTKTKMKYDGKVFHVKKNIKTKVSIAEIQQGLVINEESLKKIKKSTEENIKKLCMDFFDEYKKQELDIFNIEENFKKNHLGSSKKDVFKISQLELNVEVEVQNSIDRLNFN